MGLGPVTMSGDAGYFRFKLGNAQIEFVTRIAVKAFAA